MSILEYNSVRLPYAKTVNFSQAAVYDDSGTDRIYTKYDLTVQAVINANYLGLLNDHLTSIRGQPVTKATTDNAAQIMRSIQQQLLEQRRPLSFTFNGQELIPQPQVGLQGFVDARNGPQPQFCNVSQLSNVTFLITYRIISHHWYRPRDDQNGNIFVDSDLNDVGHNVLTNRWSETQIIDGLNRSIYRRQGRYIIRSDNAAGAVADDLRVQMAVLGVYTNFLRRRAEYRIDPSGLALEYTVEDEEQYKMPPPPAFRAEGTFTELGATVGNPLRHGICEVHLWGDNNTDQSKLLDTAIQIVTSKLLSRGQEISSMAFNPSAGLLTVGIPYQARADINMYRNEVSFQAAVQYTVATNRFGSLDSFASRTNTFTPGSDNTNNYSPSYLPYGTADILLVAARYFDPSIPDVILDSEDQLSEGLAPGQAGVIPEG